MGKRTHWHQVPKHYSVMINDKPISFFNIITYIHGHFLPDYVKKYFTQWGSSHTDYSTTKLNQSSCHHNLVIDFEILYRSLYLQIVSYTPCIHLMCYNFYLSQIFSHQKHTLICSPNIRLSNWFLKLFLIYTAVSNINVTKGRHYYELH